ncbi:hypothetical protein [Halioxenophilus sp. WMMB6]|uniref:hypothetical protein n=1 Tax=Halioxenophilus sp. WMMB6 TaxID=3073815 RepID=UPI00295F1DD6|nr:hypothetical protein [Halioxenophilus sp. WMMB6]
MTDIYQAPKASLFEHIDTNSAQYGSIEAGLRGDYELSIGAIFTEAWARTKGAKTKIWLGLLLCWVINTAISFGAQMFMAVFIGLGAVAFDDPMLQAVVPAVLSFLTIAVMFFATAPLMVGLLMLGVRRAVDAPLHATSVVNYFGKILRIGGTYLLSTLLIWLSLLLFILPAIYLGIAYFMATLVAAEKDMPVWQAMETSRKITTKKWFSFFGIFILLMLCYLALFLPGMVAIVASTPWYVITLAFFAGFIGLLWFLPFAVVTIGVMYRNMFGCEPASAQ